MLWLPFAMGRYRHSLLYDVFRCKFRENVLKDYHKMQIQFQFRCCKHTEHSELFLFYFLFSRFDENIYSIPCASKFELDCIRGRASWLVVSTHTYVNETSRWGLYTFPLHRQQTQHIHTWLMTPCGAHMRRRRAHFKFSTWSKMNGI